MSWSRGCNQHYVVIFSRHLRPSILSDPRSIQHLLLPAEMARRDMIKRLTRVPASGLRSTEEVDFPCVFYSQSIQKSYSAPVPSE